MQLPKNRFQILILHPKKHSYIQYKKINTFFNAYKLKKFTFGKGRLPKSKNGQKNLYFRGVNSETLNYSTGFFLSVNMMLG